MSVNACLRIDNSLVFVKGAQSLYFSLLALHPSWTLKICMISKCINFKVCIFQSVYTMQGTDCKMKKGVCAMGGVHDVWTVGAPFADWAARR